jgi:hypothetical protein
MNRYFKVKMDISVNYEQDFYSWLQHNARLLREGRLAEADVENIAEELEGMSRNEKRELLSRLILLIAHLLKWEFQPARRSASRERTIDEQRRQLYLILKDSPSLKYQFEEKIRESYKPAMKSAVKETSMKKTDFPDNCPYTPDQLLDEDFYPQQAD